MTDGWDFGEDVTADSPTRAFPWPPPEDGPILARLAETWKRSTFEPTPFFRQIPRRGGTGAAVVYYLVVGVLLSGVNLFWATLALGAGHEETVATGLDALHPLTRFLLAPLALLIALAASAAVTHVLLLVVGGANHGLGTTVRTFCYAYSPMAFGVVPVLGSLVGAVWSVVLAIIGLREAHETAAWRTALAVLFPLAIGLAILAVATAAVLMVSA